MKSDKLIAIINDQGDSSVGIAPRVIEIKANGDILDGLHKEGREAFREDLKRTFTDTLDPAGRVDVTFYDECANCGRLKSECNGTCWC